MKLLTKHKRWFVSLALLAAMAVPQFAFAGSSGAASGTPVATGFGSGAADTSHHHRLPKVPATRIYSDSEGKSHLQTVHIDTSLIDFSPPAPKIYGTMPTDVSKHLFAYLPVGWSSEGLHHPPARQICTVLSGTPEITTSEGVTKKFKAGDIVLFEDTTGVGHVARNAGRGLVRLSITQY